MIPDDGQPVHHAHDDLRPSTPPSQPLPVDSAAEASAATTMSAPSAVVHRHAQFLADPQPAPLTILDSLTDTPASYLVNTTSPPCRSAAARQIGAGFKWQSGLNPMVYHSEAGVVLYDRVVTGSQETRMLKKLTKPKALHPANSAIPSITFSGGAGAPRARSRSPSPSASPSQSRSASPSASSPRHPCQPNCHPSRGGNGGGGAAAASPAVKAHNIQSQSHTAAGSGTTGAVGRHRQGCSGAQNQGDPAGAGQASSAGASGTLAASATTPARSLPRTAPRKRYSTHLKSSADLEIEAASKYFHQQRATMTATQVFTWGGRLSHRSQVDHSMRGPGAARAAAAAGLTAVGGLFAGDTHRAPLRLDPLQD